MSCFVIGRKRVVYGNKGATGEKEEEEGGDGKFTMKDYMLMI